MLPLSTLVSVGIFYFPIVPISSVIIKSTPDFALLPINTCKLNSSCFYLKLSIDYVQTLDTLNSYILK